MSANDETENNTPAPEEETSTPENVAENAPVTEEEAAVTTGEETAETEEKSPAPEESAGARPCDVIAQIEREQFREGAEDEDFNVGDTVKVHTRVVEGGKERIQIFAGIVIAQGGGALNRAFTVRKISYGEGVERVFPVHSPKVARIEVTKRGKVRRAKLHYLRDRVGKQATSVRAAEQGQAVSS